MPLNTVSCGKISMVTTPVSVVFRPCSPLLPSLCFRWLLLMELHVRILQCLQNLAWCLEHNVLGSGCGNQWCQMKYILDKDIMITYWYNINIHMYLEIKMPPVASAPQQHQWSQSRSSNRTSIYLDGFVCWGGAWWDWAWSSWRASRRWNCGSDLGECQTGVADDSPLGFRNRGYL